MSLMSREDMLRELELLPVWSLHSGNTHTNSIATQIVPAILETSVLEPVLTMQETDIVETKLYRHFTNEDNDWLFVLPDAELTADEATLFRHILIAMRIKALPIHTIALTADALTKTNPKIIVVMGETIAQDILESPEVMLNLRGKLHDLSGVPMVVTYDLAHLLKTLQNKTNDKEKAWDDLCLAMQTLQAPKMVKT